MGAKLPHGQSQQTAPCCRRKPAPGGRKGKRAMPTRREFVQSFPAVGTAFALAGSTTLHGGPVRAQDAPAPLAGHFHPKGKAPSPHTLAVLTEARGALPFADTRDFDEQARGLIAPMTEMTIPADAGHVAWDMARFQFLDQQEEFDSHPPLAAPHLEAQQQLRPLRGHPRHLPGARLRPLRHHLRPRQDRLDRLRPAGRRPSRRAPPGSSSRPHVGEGLPVSAVIYSHTHADHWGGVRGDRRRGRRALRQGRADRAGRLHELHDLRERLRRQRHEPAAVLPVRPAPARRPARLRRPGPRPGRVGRVGRADRAQPLRLGADRGDRGRRRPDDLPEHAEHRGAAGDEHLHPRDEGALDGRERHRLPAQHLHAPRRAGARPAQLVEIHRRGALPLRAGGRGHVRLAPLAALGQRAHPGGAARPARPLRQHEQPGAALRQPGRDDQPDPQRLRSPARAFRKSGTAAATTARRSTTPAA